MSKNQNNQTEVNEGVGHYDFDQLAGITVDDTVDEQPVDEVTQALDEQLANDDVETQPEETGAVEPEVEEEQPEVTPEEEIEIDKEKKEAVKTSNYSSLSKKYVELGVWGDYAIEIDGEEVKISDIEDLDEELFLQISEAQDRQKKQEIDEKYINKEELDEVSLQIVDISKNGGNITQLLETKKNLIDPLDTYDLSNEEHQKALVRHKYKVENRTLSAKQIENLVNEDIKNLELEEKAEKFVADVKESYRQQIEKEKEAAIQAKEDKKKSIKNLKKSLREQFTGLELKDSFYRPLVDLAGDEDKLEEDFNNLKKDPKEFAQYLLWRNNPEEFFKRVSNKEKQKHQINTLKKLELIPNKGKGTEKIVTEPKKGKDKLEEEFNNLLKLK